MAKGIKTGGRQKGATNKKTRDIAEKAIESGITPLEFMLQILRDTTADWVTRLDAAKSAAPYIHPRLATNTIKNAEGETFKAIVEVIYK